jgi:hypothetical protein
MHRLPPCGWKMGARRPEARAFSAPRPGTAPAPYPGPSELSASHLSSCVTRKGARDDAGHQDWEGACGDCGGGFRVPAMTPPELNRGDRPALSFLARSAGYAFTGAVYGMMPDNAFGVSGMTKAVTWPSQSSRKPLAAIRDRQNATQAVETAQDTAQRRIPG